MKNTVSVYLVIISAVLQAQSYKQDVLRAYKTLRSAESYSLNLEYNMYLDGNTAKAYQSRTVSIKKQGGNLLMKQSSGFEILFTSTCRIYLDNKSRIISVMLQKPLSDMNKAIEEVNKQFEGGIDTALAVFESIKTLSETKTQRIYECIYINNPEYIKATMTVNKKTGLIERVVSELKEPIESKIDKRKHRASLEIKYNGFSPGAVFENNTFSSSAYISTSQKGEILPVPQFSKYQFILSK
jgi:hypothetical protein